MKILILDDDGTTLYEQENLGYIHLPDIIDDKYTVDCDDDVCEDPRCVELRKESEETFERFVKDGTVLALVKIAGSEKFEKFLALSADEKQDKKVQLRSWTHNELVFTSGERVSFTKPHLNVYGDDQVMFTTEDYDLSLSPWSDLIHGKTRN
jgi:hypothetical protein